VCTFSCAAQRRRFTIGFNKVNETPDLFPIWQKQQISSFIKHVGFYSRDLVEGYQAKRIHSLAQALRNLLELDVWAEYGNTSEENAKEFFDDMSRDIRKVIDSAPKTLYADQPRTEREAAPRFCRSPREPNLRIIVGKSTLSPQNPRRNRSFGQGPASLVDFRQSRRAAWWHVGTVPQF
jgi:hypothetical protein